MSEAGAKRSHVDGARVACLAAFALVTLPGCAVVSTVTGVAAGVATGTATGNPAVGASVAIAVKAGVDEAGKRVSRQSQEHEQDAIAAAAGNARVGESATWQVKHRLTRSVDHGEVRVLRVIRTPLTECKEVLFSVVKERGEKIARSWFKTNTCQNGEQWKWALAEPAVERWGNLQ
ncbi:MAG: hypothetical protein V7640_3138 [Betaproteobacteria bacterium]|jgi:hypothetical protein